MFACGLAALVAMIALGACGTDPVGVESCRTIEQARCENAPRCGIDLTYPVHRGDDVSECIRYYHDACLHGLVASVDPGQTIVQVCVDAINNGDCKVVTNPETVPACAFLNAGNASTTDGS